MLCGSTATAAREEEIPEYRAELGASLGKIKEKNKTNKKPKKKATGGKGASWLDITSVKYTHKLQQRSNLSSLTLGLVT